MKPYNERLPLIDAAIDHCKGVLPKNFCNQNGSFYSDEGHIKQLVDRDYLTVRKICTHDEFNQRAKELGYINGYKYGVEYETNGEKPGLPDDVAVEVKAVYRNSIDESDGNDWLSPRIVEFNNWENTIKFRIVDERYKPREQVVCECGLSQCPRPISVEKTKEQDMNNDWYEKDEVPPVGTKCKFIGSSAQNSFLRSIGDVDCEIVAHTITPDKHNTAALFHYKDSEGINRYHAVIAGYFRPLYTETDKLVDEAELDIRSLSPELDRQVIRKMIEAGYRKIKPMSEDEFVKYALKWFGSKRFEVSQLKLVCEALRKLHKAGLRFIDNGGDK